MNITQILKQNIAGKLLNHGIVFLINIAIVRILGASGSGYYFNELYLLNFFVFIFSAGLDYAAIAWLSREPNLLNVIHQKLINVSLFFIAALLFFGLILLPKINFNFIQPALAIILFGAGNIMLVLFQGVLSAFRKFNIQNGILAITNTVFLFYLIFFINTNDHTKVFQVSIGYAILYFAQGILMVILSYKKSTAKQVEINWLPFYRHGIFIMFSSLIYFCFLRIDNFFVEKNCDSTTLSNYVQCGKIGQYFIYFSSVISSTLLPFISSEKLGSNFNEWKKMMKPYIILVLIGAIILTSFGQIIYPFLFGHEFLEMNNLMLILLPGYVCLAILTLMNAIYIGKGNIKKIFKGDLMGLIIVLSFDSFLVPEYGAKAAAVISSVAYCMVFLYLWHGLKNQFSVNNK